MGKYLFGIKFKDYRISKDDKTGIVDASIQFGTDDMHWYILSWLLKNGFAWVRVTPKDYLEYIENGKKDLVHFHLPSKVMPTEELMRILAKIVVKYIYMIEHGKEPTVMDSDWKTLFGIFNIKSDGLKFYIEDSFNVMARMIKELDKNEFRPMISINNDDGIFIDNWMFTINKGIKGIGYKDYTMAKLYPDTYKTMTEISSEDLKSDGSVDLITDSLEVVFSNCYALVSMPKINYTNKATSMSLMFSSCKSLISLDLSYFDTSNVTDMVSVFGNYSYQYANQIDKTIYHIDYYACTSLKSLDLSGWNTSKVINMKDMFNGCTSLTTIEGISNWDTSKVTNMMSMFANCKSLTSLNLSNWNTSNITDMGLMFGPTDSDYYYRIGCSSLTTIGDISNWNTSKVTNMRGMFCSCKSLTSLNVSNFDTSKVTNMNSMFADCEKLTSLDVSNFDTSKVTDMSFMFGSAKEIYYDGGCSSLTTIGDISNWNTSKVTNMRFLFYGCKSLTSLNISNWDTGNVTNMNSMFGYCSKLTSLDLSNWDTSNVTNMHSMFNNCEKLTSLGVSNWDTSNVTNMGYMFFACRSIISLDLSNWDTSNVTDMHSMFCLCNYIAQLDISNWNTGNVTNMSSMFSGCYWSLTSLNISNFDTSKVTDMSSMFSGCEKLTSLDISNWNTSKVKDMDIMFENCLSLVSLDLSNWDTSNVTDMRAMFFDCKSLTLLNISNWDTSKVISFYIEYLGGSKKDAGIFSNCINLTTIIGEIDMSSCTNYQNMFKNCPKLTGVKLKNVPKDFDPSVAGLSAGQYTILSYRS